MHVSRHRGTRDTRKMVWALLSCALILVVIAAAGAWFSDAVVVALARTSSPGWRLQELEPAWQRRAVSPRSVILSGMIRMGMGRRPVRQVNQGSIGVVIRLYRQINTTWVLEQETVTGDNPATPKIETGWYGFDIAAIFGDYYQVSVDPVNFQAGGALYGFVFTSANTYGPTPYEFEIDSSGIYQNFDIDFGYRPIRLCSWLSWPAMRPMVGSCRFLRGAPRSRTLIR